MKYLDQYKQMHKEGKFGGWSLEKHLVAINISLDVSDTVLDYGCGKAKYHPDGWVKYDPAVDAYSELPDGPFDAVICTDVLEHIPEEEIDDALGKIFDRATKLVYLSIATKPAKKCLPNGENAHCTIKNEQWWEDRIKPFKKELSVRIVYD